LSRTLTTKKTLGHFLKVPKQKDTLGRRVSLDSVLFGGQFTHLNQDSPPEPVREYSPEQAHQSLNHRNRPLKKKKVQFASRVSHIQPSKRDSHNSQLKSNRSQSLPLPHRPHLQSILRKEHKHSCPECRSPKDLQLVFLRISLGIHQKQRNL